VIETQPLQGNYEIGSATMARRRTTATQCPAAVGGYLRLQPVIYHSDLQSFRNWHAAQLPTDKPKDRNCDPSNLAIAVIP
jgi:hypothetical protein